MVQQEAETMHRLSDLFYQLVDRLLVGLFNKLVECHQLLCIFWDAPDSLLNVLVLFADPGTEEPAFGFLQI